MPVPIQNNLHTSHIVLSSCSWRTACAQFVLNALPSVLERLVPPEDLGWRQNSIPKSCPQQLQHLGTRLSEFRTELDRLTLLQTTLHFRSWQDTKTTMHFANVPTATKARTELSKVQLYTWVPPPSTATATILSWLYCAVQKNHSHYFWDRPCMKGEASVNPSAPEKLHWLK
jgi:hypothetical protein